MFTDRLKSVRAQSGLSQKEVAERLFISQQAYAKYEIGTSSPNPETLSNIAKLFGVSVDYLLGNEPIEQVITERDLQVALFGGDEEVTDEMWEEVKSFAEFVKSKNKGK